MAFAASPFRIVLFGLPEAGKTSLLGALAEASQNQQQTLGGKLNDKTGGLVKLERQLYDGRPRETLEEIVSYPVTVTPLPSDSAPAAEAILVDSGGKAVNHLLEHTDDLGGALANKALSQAVLGADTLVLAVDASTEPAQVKRDFGLCTDFLHALEQVRGRKVAVAGMPVFLVLTKADLLARPEDTTVAWMDRIEERKREVHRRFEEFLSERAAEGQEPFGKIDLHVWATAVKRPTLADAAARPREPYGVAELFRQCLDEADTFRGRGRIAAGRLAWVLGAVTAMVAFMVLLGLFLVAEREQTEIERLERDIRTYRSEHGEGIERLRPPVSGTIKDLSEFKQSPLFAKMPTDLQSYVGEHLQEAQDYDDFARKFQAAVRRERLRDSPRLAQDQTELDAFRKVLTEMPIPNRYQSAWEATEIARKQRQWKDEIEVMETEVKAAEKAFSTLFELDAKIKDRKKYTGDQLDQFAEELKQRDRSLPYRKDNNASVRGSRVTYANVAQFTPVAVLLAQYQDVRAYHKL